MTFTTLRVYHWITWMSSPGEKDVQVDHVVAATSEKEACKIGGYSHSVYRRCGSEASDRDAIAAAMANPRTLMYATLDDVYAPGPTEYRVAPGWGMK